MIAVSESSRNDMVLLFKTFRGYAGGNTEPVDFISTGQHRSLDENLAMLGFRRTEDWRPIAHRPGAVYARVSAS